MALQRKNIVTGGDMCTPVIFIKQNHQTISFQVKLWRKSFSMLCRCIPTFTKDLDLTNNEASLTMVTYHPIDIEISNDMYFEIQLLVIRIKIQHSTSH